MAMVLGAATTVFWGVLTFSILIVLHEGGHFLVARAFGVKVHEFMIGLPGPAIRFKAKSGTRFGMTMVPLGGYVRIAGMEPGAEDELLAPTLMAITRAGRADSVSIARVLEIDRDRAAALLATLADWGAVAPAEDDDYSYVPLMEAELDESAPDLLGRARRSTYRGLPTRKRIAVLAAGVAVNLISAVLVFTVVLSVWGYWEPSLRIAAVGEGTAAEAAGLRVGDVIDSMDGVALEDWNGLVSGLARFEPGTRVPIAVTRDGSVRTFTVTLGSGEGGTAYLGVSPEGRHVDLSAPQALVESVSWIGLVFKAIIEFFNPSTFQHSVQGARSVVGISVEVTRAAEDGPLSYAWIVALLSLSLGVMNVLPIPPLDGGKITLELIEKAMGRPIRREVSLGLSVAGALLLFSFIGYVMYADVLRYFVNS